MPRNESQFLVLRVLGNGMFALVRLPGVAGSTAEAITLGGEAVKAAKGCAGGDFVVANFTAGFDANATVQVDTNRVPISDALVAAMKAPEPAEPPKAEDTTDE